MTTPKAFKLTKQPESIAFFVVLVLGFGRLLTLSRWADLQLVTAIPDDAFYYLQLSRQRIETGRWTFDGVNLTSGFHPLHAYLLSIYQWIFPRASWRSIWFSFSFLNVLCMSTAAFLMARRVRSFWGRPAAYASVLPLTSIICLEFMTSLMESYLVVVIAVLLIYLLFDQSQLSFSGGSIIFAIGALGSLSRQDFGLWPASLFAAVFLLDLRRSPILFRKSSLALTGAAAGALAVVAQNASISGTLNSGSSAVKLFWSSLFGHSPRPALGNLLDLMFPWMYSFARPRVPLVSEVLLLSIIVMTLLVVGSAWRNRKRGTTSNESVIVVGATLTLLGYVGFYSFNSQATQAWYMANFVIPIGVLIAAFVNYLLRSTTGSTARIFLVVLTVSHLWTVLTDTNFSRYSHQSAFLEASNYLNVLDSKEPVGAWNAGILGFFSERRIVNLDGLVNDEIYPYITTNSLDQYLEQEGVFLIADFEVMLDSYYQKRGGYASNEFMRCIKQVDTVSSSEVSGGLGLYRFRPGCDDAKGP